MILSRMDLKAFGRFTDVSIDLSAGPRRFHLIYGPNESGKSTSLRAITSLLFGMPQAADDCFLHRNDQVRVGGLLVDPASGTTLECVRRRGRKATLRDAEDNEPIDEAKMEAMLGGVTRETFLARFGLSYEALVKGGSAMLAGNGDLGQILFAAGAGVGRLREIQAELDEGASQLFLPRGSKSTINAALRQMDEDRKALREAQVPVADFEQLRQRLAGKQREAENLDKELRECALSLATMRAFQEAIPIVPSWHATKQQLAQVADAPRLDENFTERRRQIAMDRETAISRQKELEARLLELTEKLQSLGCDPIVLSYEAEIQEVFQHISARQKGNHERSDLIRSREQLDREIHELLSELSGRTQGVGSIDADVTVGACIGQLRINESLRSRIRELAAAHGGLISRRNDASELVETAKRRLADTLHEIEQMDSVSDPAILASVIESIGNPETEMDALVESRRKCEALRQRCEAMLDRLQGFEGNLEQASRLVLPSDASIQQSSERLRNTLHEVSDRESRLHEAQKERDATQHRVLEAQAECRLPSLAELQEVRRQRDELALRIVDTAHDGESLILHLEELQRQIRVADEMSDTMRQHADQLHRRETLQSQLAMHELKVIEAKKASEQAHAAFETARSQWTSIWRSCRIEAGQPEEMQQWLNNHNKLCEWMNQLETEERRLEQIQSRVDRSVRRLRNALDSIHSGRPVRTPSTFQADLFDEPSDDDLLALYDEAVALRSQWTRDWQQLESLRRKKDELADELPRVEGRFEAAQKAVDNWYEDWRHLTESFVKSDRVDTAEVLHMLDRISQLNGLNQQRDSVASRLEAIDKDESAYTARVLSLAKAIGHASLDQQSSISLAQALYQRLQTERSASRSRETLAEQIESSRNRLSVATGQRNESEASLRQLCTEAGCGSSDELPEVEHRARRRCELEATVADLECNLRRLAGEQVLEDFADLVSEQQAAVLDVDIERMESRQQELKLQLEQVHREIGAAQYELSRIDGGSRASDLAQSIQLSAGLIRTDVDHYARLRIGAMILKRAIDHYRQENQNPVLALANRYFRQLTCGEYVELKPDYDASGTLTLFGANASGGLVPVSGMSTGTADALYLALRLASLEHQMKHGTTVPVVIDDCLIQLDDARAAAALQAFSDLSEKTQVILFTHHHHLCQLAEQNLQPGAYHLHQIGA